MARPYTTRSLDFLDSPGYWGAFARANPYYLYAPLNDETNRFTGGVDYTYNSWSFHYAVGYQTFTENISLNNVSLAATEHQPHRELYLGAAHLPFLVAVPAADHSHQRLFFRGEAARETTVARRLHLLPL